MIFARAALCLGTASIMSLAVSVANAEVIFEENFDDQPDYVSRDILSRGHQLYRFNGDPIPEGWDAISDWSMYSEPHLAILASDAGKARGGTGKSLVMRRGSRDGGWGGDAQLAKNFDPGLDELYVKFWIKFQPGWTHDGQTKLFRIGSYAPEDLSGSGYWGNLGMGIIWDWRALAVVDSGLRNLIHLSADVGGTGDMTDPPPGASLGARWDGGKFNGNHGADPREIPSNTSYLTDYVNGGVLPDSYGFSHEQVFSDGWHKMEFHIKMNSAPGVRDGVIQQWMDGVKLVESFEMAWLQNGSPDPNRKFNAIKFGGNDNFMAYPNSEEVQEWYVFDDIEIHDSLPSERERTGISPNPPTDIVIE